MVYAGWYPDYEDPSAERYWDGLEWTTHTRPWVDQTMPSPEIADARTTADEQCL
jgi:hypothetical protein